MQPDEAETRARLAAIVESSDDAIVGKTLDGLITSWNRGAERIFGYSAAEAIGQQISLIIPRERLPEEAGVLERLRRGEKIDHFETERRRKDGRLIAISLTVSPIRNAEGKLVGASKVARDISERKSLETALREADRIKDEFLATLSHELRGPLAPITNAIYLLREAADEPSTVRQVSGVLDRQVGNLVRLVDDLLDLQRMNRGRLELHRQLVDLGAIVGGAVELCRGLLDRRGHQLEIDLPSPPVKVSADPVRLTQVVANLLNNAAKYTPQGGQIVVQAGEQDGDVVIRVRDNGVGIAAELLPRIFEMFTQAEKTRGMAQGGLGIGLTLARHLARLHGGEIEARSEGYGSGAEFIVRVPQRAGKSAGRAPAATGVRPARNPRRVLVLDDDLDAARSLGSLLERMGHEVQVTNDGEAALRAARGEPPPSVFLLDLGMPGLDGFAVAKRLRGDPRLKGARIVAVTGRGGRNDQERSVEAGFDEYILKPVGADRLEHLLRTD